MAPKHIRAKLPSWLSPIQVAQIEAGYRHLGAYSNWWAIEDGKSAGTEATANAALLALDQALATQSNRSNWAAGDFGRYSGCAQGAGNTALGLRSRTRETL